MREWQERQFGKTFTKEEAALNQKRREVTQFIRQGKTGEAVAQIAPMIKDMQIDPNRAVSWMMNAYQHPKVAAFQRVPADIAIKALMVATPEERILLEPYLGQKIRNAANNTAAWGAWARAPTSLHDA